MRESIPTQRYIPKKQKEFMLNAIRRKLRRVEIFKKYQDHELAKALIEELKERENEYYEQFRGMGNANIPAEREYTAFRVLQQQINQVISMLAWFESPDRLIEQIKNAKKGIEDLKESDSSGDTAPKPK